MDFLWKMQQKSFQAFFCISYHFWDKRGPKGQKMSFLGPCEIFICHPILMGFFSLDSSQNELSVKFNGFFLSLTVFEIIGVKDAKKVIWPIIKFSTFLLAHLAKGHVSFCHHLASVVRPSSVNFSHFNLLLWNYQAKFNQTWQGASMWGPLRSLLILSRSDKKHGRHGRFLFLICWYIIITSPL